LPARYQAPQATPEALNQSWSIDFMHYTLTYGRRFRAFNIFDDFTMKFWVSEHDLNILMQWVVQMLDRIVAHRRFPLRMRIDNGPELVSLALAQWAEDRGLMLELSSLISRHRTPLSNGLNGRTGHPQRSFWII